MNCVIISSACASWVATTFTTQQRFIQTIDTIASIRKFIPVSYIVMWDTTNLHDDLSRQFQEKCDLYIDLKSHPQAVHASQQDKSLGETCCMRLVLQELSHRNLDIIKWFKMSARYSLTDKFVFDNWNTNTFRMTYEHAPCYHTTFYSFKSIDSYQIVLNQVWELLTQCRALNIESALVQAFQYTNQHVNIINQIGIVGQIGGDSKIYQC